LFYRKLFKIVITRSTLLAQNAPQAVWAMAALRPVPLGELTALPRPIPPSWIKGRGEERRIFRIACGILN